MWRLPPKNSANAKVLLSVGLLLTGIAAQLALPPGGWWPLAFVALVPLWRVCQRYPPLTATLAGLCWGLGFYGSSLVWVWDLHPLMWIGIDPLPSWLISRGIWLFLSLWGASLSALWAFCMARFGCQGFPRGQLLWGITLWCGLEALWSYSPLWWISLSLTQSPQGVVQLSRVAGPTTITAFVVLLNGLIVLGGHRQRRYWYTALGVLLLGLLLNRGLGAMGAADQGTGLRVGLLQGNIPTREKLTPAGIRRAWLDYHRGYRQLVAMGAAAVLTPEGALPLLWQPEQPNLLSTAVQDAGVPLWLGTFMEAPAGQHQVLITLDATGNIFSRYNKVKLVPLGEYIPDWLTGVVGRLSTLQSRLIPGDPHQVFQTPWGNAVVLICFESAFSHRSRTQVQQGGLFILSVANNDPYRQQLMAQHHGHDVLRAVESDRWLVRATNTGLSAVIAPTGQTRWLSVPDQFVLHAHTIYPRGTFTLYGRYGDWLLPLLVLLTVARCAPLALRQPRSH